MRAFEPTSRPEASLEAGAYARSATHARRLALAGGFLTLALLAGCNQTSRMHTGSIGPSTASSTSTAPRGEPALSEMSAEQLASAVRAYGARYEGNPKDKANGLAFASALQMNGRNEQSLAVMRQVAIAHPDDRDVLAAYGKALAAAGDLPKALETVRRAQTPDRPDWRLLSAEGAILDQLGQPEKARVLYEKALVLEPNEPSILSNLGMSYLLSKDLPKSETYLSRAVKLPGADARVRQNLALVMGLQGRFDEAERTASAVLSPDEAKANVAYLRQMLAQKNTWSELAAEDRG
ncbi:tetratricopeptide repeat protein [Aureimonas sp. Leaf324]|jgi:Flp pilus assembly protein TadD|uniref:tetratricopeptide repeat protein n=1 Tax=Aureimonas sp. Leaf324 TaxID=1736336 RepID=UPI0006FF3DCA|nr:tetratricopeptide repeat protein [Aureimonas sp. Leaf324]KQQ79543.1 pilus assembly protein TadD [Aureimonas sp. Leaf324]